MKEYLFIFKKECLFSEIKIKADYQREAERFLRLLVKVDENEVEKVICINEKI